jgi:catechol 2,3-dioxygenase-like lactoylglutathione lyase family enzyme
MLVPGKTVAFVPSSDLERAERFYVDLLGLARTSRDDFALVVEANGVTIRIARADGFEPQPFTILGFDVEDVARVAQELASKGVSLQHFPGMRQDALGIWTAPRRLVFFEPQPPSLVLGEEARASSPRKAKLFEPPLHAAAPPISMAGVSLQPRPVLGKEARASSPRKAKLFEPPSPACGGPADPDSWCFTPASLDAALGGRRRGR